MQICCVRRKCGKDNLPISHHFQGAGHLCRCWSSLQTSWENTHSSFTFTDDSLSSWENLTLKKPKLGVHTSATIKKRIYFFSISGVPQFVKKNRSLECLELKHTDKSFCQKPGCKFCRNSSFLVRRPSSSWTHYLLDHQERNRVAHPGHVSHDFIESWLINRDPYNGWLWSPHNWIV